MKFRQEVEIGLRPGEELSDIEDWAGKYAGHVLRLAAGLHFWETTLVWQQGGLLPCKVPMSETTMQQAITIGRHYATHTHITYSVIREGGHTEVARQLWAYLERLGSSEITQRDLWRGVRRRFTPWKNWA